MSFKQKSELKDPRITNFLLDSSKMQQNVLDEPQLDLERKTINEQLNMVDTTGFDNNYYMLSVNKEVINEKNNSDFVQMFNNENNPELNSQEILDSKGKESFMLDQFNNFCEDFDPSKMKSQIDINKNSPIKTLDTHQNMPNIIEEDLFYVRNFKPKLIEVQPKDKDIADDNQNQESSQNVENINIINEKISFEQQDLNGNETKDSQKEPQESKNLYTSVQQINNSNGLGLEQVLMNECEVEKKPEEINEASEFDFKYIKCPNHFKEDISFICNAPECNRKFMCCKCLVDDIKNQTRHHIIHEEYLIQYDENVFKNEYEKFLIKKSNFDKILNDKDYQLLEQIEQGEFSTILQKKYQNEVKEIESFIENVTTKTKDILLEFKGLIKENVANDAQIFLKDILNNFTVMKDEFKFKSMKMQDMQKRSLDIFTKDEREGSFEKVDFFLKMHQENLEESLFQKFTYFLQNSLKTLKEYTSRESNRALKYEFYISLMNSLKIMINEKIPKNLLNSNYSLLLKSNVNNLLKEKEDNLKEKKAIEIIESKNKLTLSKNDRMNQQIRQDMIEIPPIQIINAKEPVFGVEAPKNNLLYNPIERISSKHFYDIDYCLVLDICLIGPTEKNEYFVATCCSKEKFIKIWTLPKDKAPTEYKSLEGHNKSTYKLFYCHEKKWLLSAGLDGSVKSWDVLKNFELGMYYKEERDPVNSIAYNGALDLFASSHTLFTRVWKIRKEYFVKIEAEYSIQEPTDLLLLNFPNTDERCRLVIGNEKGEIYFCDYLNGKNIRSRKEPIRAHSKGVWKLVFNQTRKYVISCCKDDNTIIFWDPYNMERLEEFTFSESKMIKGFFWSQTHEQILISTGNNQVFFLEWQNSEHEIKKIYESELFYGFNELVFLHSGDLQVLVVYTNEKKNVVKKTNNNMEASYFLKYIYF